jgi:putative ABC transport system permease protein
MNIVLLVWNYLKAKPLTTVLNTVLLALGIGVITVLFLFGRQLEEKIASNSRGIDLVVGAKGSPLQLILCNLFHIDFPTGNINLAEAEKIARNRNVKEAIPLALGDSYQAYRIVGTTKAFAAVYSAELASGAWWGKPMEVVLGAQVASMAGLTLGDEFESAHGLTEAGHSHEQHFVVAGILKPTNSVADNLIITSVQSIWEVHEESEEHHEHGEVDHHDPATSFVVSPLVPGHAAGDTTREITSLLVKYRNPVAAIQLPRMINSQTQLQAASPAFETARLFTILGIGADILMVFAYVLIFISGLSIFIALYNSLKERKYDLAILRSMGASRTRVMITLLMEGMALTTLGSLIGLALGHGVVMALAALVAETQRAGFTGMVFYAEEWIILAGSLLLGLLCALLPSWQAYRTDISKVLAGNS